MTIRGELAALSLAWPPISYDQYLSTLIIHSQNFSVAKATSRRSSGLESTYSNNRFTGVIAEFLILHKALVFSWPIDQGQWIEVGWSLWVYGMQMGVSKEIFSCLVQNYLMSLLFRSFQDL